MDQQDTLLITGGNTGLGFQIVRALCRSSKGYLILLAGRSSSKVEQAITSVKEEFPASKSHLEPMQIDIEDDGSIQKAFEKVQARYGRLDVLINNAGAQLDQELTAGRMTMRELWNKSWEINTTGTQVMTSVFAPLLLKSSNPRLMFIASGTSTLAGTDNMALAVNHVPAKGWPKPAGLSVAAYRSSKTGMNMMMREWYRILKEDSVKVWGVSPGFLATGLGGDQEANKKRGAGDPEVAANFICSVLEGSRDGDVGKVILRDGVQPW